MQDSHPYQLFDQPLSIEQASSGAMSEASLYRHKKALYAVKKGAKSLPNDENTTTEEVRVISDLILRCRNHTINTGQWDWSENQIPTFFTFYTEQGTVRNFLQRNNTVFLPQKRNFAIDIASGLHALHAADVAHGDINLDNTLVFPNPNNDGSWMSKVSNFTSSIFGLSSRRQTLYSGTTLYSAPEVRGRHAPILSDQLIQCESYSYGLLAWEIIKDGDNYFDPCWIEEDSDTNETLCREDYLKTLPVDGLLSHALSFLCSRYTTSSSLDVHLFYHVLRLSLKDNPMCRKDLATIALALDYCDS
ncbi:hypothetical protein ACLX1H_010269 [Fusarium chlamydosporum]